jgi:small ligand-binding sensory domain FIST
LLAGLDFALPNVPKVGGLASGSRHPGGNPLFVGRSRVDSGAVLMSFGGNVRTAPVVAQGCRPIGRPGRVTKADRNRLVAVDDVPARRFVEEQLATLPREDAALARRSPLFLGIASDPFSTEQPAAGDYLVRNVLGIDPRGHVVVGEHMTIGRSVQLHLRDGESGLMDLEQQLTRAGAESAGAVLMFRCIGRDGADHDLFAGVANGVPMAGCTCYGEIGPVGEVTHLHGYTATCLLLQGGGEPA